MPPIRLTYPPPVNEQDFEELCLQLLRVHCSRPQLELYAHRGEGQSGVDVFDPSAERPVLAAQCKLHGPSKGLRPAEIRAEVRKAGAFSPALDYYIILTTAKRTAATQQMVRKINAEHQAQGLFLVELITWERIEELLQKYAHVGSAFYRTLGSETVGRLEEDLASMRRSVSALGDALTTLPKDHAIGTALVEYASIGDSLKSSRLRGEFLFNTRDLVLWEESELGPEATVRLFEHHGGSYQPAANDLNGLIPYATRIHAAAVGGVVVVQEHAGIFHLDPSSTGVTRSVLMPILGDPMIGAEVVHPAAAVVVFGTHYGMLVAWDWARNEMLFCRRYFPRDDIVWMTALAVDERSDLIFFAVNNVLYDVRLADGELVRKRPLGPVEETAAIAFSARAGLLAVGGLMCTRVYKLGNGLDLLHEIRNPQPMTHQLCFSPDGRLLTAVTGLGIGLGSRELMIIDVTTGRVVCRHGQAWPPRHMPATWCPDFSHQAVSFSTDGDLLAIGEGGRVAVYGRPIVR